MWIDISKVLYEGMEVFPGDSNFQYRKETEKRKGDPVNTGTIIMSSHTGTHLDAPFHYDESGRKIHELDINELCGMAEVVDVSEEQTITKQCLQKYLPLKSGIILFKTTEDIHGYNGYPPLEPEAVELLSAQGIHLIGVDTPSVDNVESEKLPAHHMCRKRNMLILEGLDLSTIKEGIYELAAMPLRLHEADGSPVRAALRHWR